MQLGNISHDVLVDVLDYNQDTGIFVWKKKRNHKIVIGSVAGCVRPDGYLVIGFMGKNHLAHRLAWFYVYGAWPENHIDHIDGDKTNNKISNLRNATASENHQNKYKAASNSGLVGVSWCKREKLWRAYIKVNGVMRSLGYHKTKNDARIAYVKAKTILHPFASQGALSICV